MQQLLRHRTMNNETGVIRQNSFMKEQIGVELLVHDNFVMVKAVEIPEKVGSIYVPDQYKKDQRRSYHIGLVLGFGDAAFDPETFGPRSKTLTNIKIGDWVYYSSYEREQISIGDYSIYMMRDSRIYMTIPESVLPILIPELYQKKDEQPT